MRFRGWLQSLGSAAALLVPPAALVMFLPGSLPPARYWPARRAWAWVWIPLLVLGLSRLAGQDGWWLVAAAVVGALYTFLVAAASPRLASCGLAAALLTFVVCGLVESTLQRTAWHSYSGTGNALAATVALFRGSDHLTAPHGPAAYGQLWQVPQGAGGLTVEFELRSTAVGAPDGGQGAVAISFARAGRPAGADETFTLAPTSGWTGYSWSVVAPSAEGPTRRTLVLRVPQGQAVQVRGLRVLSASGTPARRIAFQPRAKLWYTDPNLAGHSAALAGLVALSFSGSPVLSGVVFAAAAGAVVLTGSRAALLALLVAGCLILARGSRVRRWVLPLVALLSVGVFVELRPETLEMLTQFSVDVNSVSRQEIWQFALELARARPWTGWGAGGFAEQWRLAHADASITQVTHAHGLLLEFLVAYGLPGAVAIVVLLLALLRVGWTTRSLDGIAIAGAVVLMNALDYTFFASTVAALLALAFNTPGTTDLGGGRKRGAVGGSM